MAIVRFQYAPVDMWSVDFADQLLQLLGVEVLSTDNGSDAFVMHLADGSILSAFGSFSYGADGPLGGSTLTGVGVSMPSGIALTITGIPVATIDYVLSSPNAYAEMLAGLPKDIAGSALDDTLVGGNANDTIQGGDGEDLLIGGMGNDTLTGGAGTDWLMGDDGSDNLTGGAGDDIYFVEGADVLKESADGGLDTVHASNYTLKANFENLSLLGVGTRGSGNELDNGLWGTSGNDTLDGRGGADTMWGGGGSDTYYVDSVLDTIAYTAGIDTVRASLDFVLGPGLENLVLTGVAIYGDGNGMGNAITGNGIDQTLRGFGGADTLDGGGGADRLVGGAGADRLLGRSGADRLLGGDGDDVLTVDAFDFTKPGVCVSGGAGTDEIRLAAGEDLDLTAVAGQIEGVERIDLRVGGAHELTLDASLHETFASGVFVIYYDADDTFTVTGESINWTMDPEHEGAYYYEVDGFEFHVFGPSSGFSPPTGANIVVSGDIVVGGGIGVG